MTNDRLDSPEDQAPDSLLDHEYDGIQEYDNPLPMWWKAIFWASIVFMPLYVLFFHFGPGLLPNDRFDVTMAAFYERQAQELAALGKVTDSTLDTVRQNPAMLANAEKVFAARCASCHGFFGEGNIGPNLTDEYWIHGGRLTEIYHTIMEGVPEKGMVSWKTQLPPADLMALAAYVGTRQGANPPNAKAAEGKHVELTAMVIADDGGNEREEAAEPPDAAKTSEEGEPAATTTAAEPAN